MSETILKAEHLKKVFTSGKKTFTAVDDVNFELKKGQCLGIVGESGSGKSTIARMITGLEPMTEGTVTLLGKDITDLKAKEMRKVYRDIQMVFQMPVESFDPRRTLGDGIMESLRNMGMSVREAKKRAGELLIRCGLTPEFAARYPHEVSGGQCQRAAIARALAVSPSVLICDEATSSLDVTVQKQVLNLLLELKEKEGLSLLMISHDLALVQAFCDEVLVLYQGKAVELGTPDEIINHPSSEYTRILMDSVL
nr:ABC transporter ATP-binding protein [uncultured Blautia sp.]